MGGEDSARSGAEMTEEERWPCMIEKWRAFDESNSHALSSFPSPWTWPLFVFSGDTSRS